MLKSDKRRKTFFKENFSYVEPTQIFLGSDSTGKQRYFQYVPIKETLKSLLRQPTIREQYKQSKLRRSPDMVLEDVSDSQNVKDNALLQHYPSFLSLILYQDAFEVVNPLGSGKKKHKILAVYMTLGEILPHNRSSVDAMQLVLLSKDTDFKTFVHNKVFSSLIADLKDMEETGVLVEDGTIMKAALIAILGDNLGSHCIGGFTENFSCSKHFCR